MYYRLCLLILKELVGADVVRTKRAAEQEPGHAPLTPTTKATRAGGGGGGGGATLKRKKSKVCFEQDDLLCPFEQQG